MLQIRLSKPASESGGSLKPGPGEAAVTVACPDHLVLADLPVAKGLGLANNTTTTAAVIKTLGRRSRRQLGHRVHFCVRCDFPIAIYGRLSPCKHAFCLDCARTDSLCHLCDERIQKIQTIKMMEGIFICAAPHCLKSFLNKSDFESHINETHADLFQSNQGRDGNESEAMSVRKMSASDSTVQAPQKPFFPPNSNSQVQDREDRSQPPQSREEPPSRPVLHPRPGSPFHGQVPNHPSDQQPDGNQSQVFERAASQNFYPQQTFDPQGGLRQDSVNPHPFMPPAQFGYAPFAPDGTQQQFFGAPYEMSRTDATPEAGSKQGPAFSFSPGPPGPMNFPQNYPGSWSVGLGSVPLEPPMLAQGTKDGFLNADPQGRGFFQGDYRQNVGNLPPPTAANQGMEHRQGGNFVDGRDATGSLPPPPPSLPPHLPQLNRGGSFSGDRNHDAPPGFGWPQERRDSFGAGKD